MNKKQLRLVRQDGLTSLRIVLVDSEENVVHIGDEPFQFTAPDIEKLMTLHSEAALCFSKPILTIPTKRGTKGKSLEWTWPEQEEEEYE